jgi:hypothetical protein
MAIRKTLKGQNGLFSRSGMDEGHHNLRVAVSFILHSKSPQILCQENSTSEHH